MNLNFTEQMSIYSSLTYCIGSGSGITSYLAQLFIKKTLWVDLASTSVSGCPPGDWITYPKKLEVEDFTFFNKITFDELIEYIESGIWTNLSTQSFGLKLISLDPTEILDGVKEFLSGDSSLYTSTHDLFIDYNFKITRPSQLILKSSAMWIHNLLRSHHGFSTIRRTCTHFHAQSKADNLTCF